MSVYVYVI